MLEKFHHTLPDGHEIVLPDVREHVGRACGQREAVGAGWNRGEAVTLLVSLVRGVAEAVAAGTSEGEGEWWIAADGRPMFAFVDGTGESIVSAARVLVDRVAAAVDDRVLARAIDDIRSGLDHPDTIARRLDDLEEPLFEAAAPQPIQSEVRGGSDRREGRRIVPEGEHDEGRLAWLRDVIDRHIDASMGDLLRDAVSSIRSHVAARRTRRPTRPAAARGTERRRGARWPLAIVGSVAAGLVIAVGLLWPASPPDARAREEVVTDLTPEATAPSGAPETDEPSAGEPRAGAELAADPVAAAGELLKRWDACGSACDAPERIERAGAVADAARVVTLIDDYGAVALIEVSAPDHESQLLVIERVDELWRVRDLYAAP